MFNHRWTCAGSLDEICRELHAHHFHPKIFQFITVTKEAGWYRIDTDTWLLLKTGKNDWQLYFWYNLDPRPFIDTIVKLKGFK